MENKENSVMKRLSSLERELILWRVLALAAGVFLTVAFAQERSQKEIRLASEDGRQVLTLSPHGIELSDRGKKLGEIGFETIGDGDDQEAIIKLTGQVTANRMFVQEGKNRLALTTERVGFVDASGVRTTLTPDGVQLQGPGARSRISLTTPSQGLGGLDFVNDGKLILALGALGKFRGGNPPRQDTGAIHIGDFGPDPKTRLITASESELHTTH